MSLVKPFILSIGLAAGVVPGMAGAAGTPPCVLVVGRAYQVGT